MASKLLLTAGDQLSKESQGFLCEPCSQVIDVDELLKVDDKPREFNHHSTFAQFLASVARGCTLCSAVWKMRENFGALGIYKHNLHKYRALRHTPIVCKLVSTTGERTMRWTIRSRDRKEPMIGALGAFTTDDDPISSYFGSRPVATDCSSETSFRLMRRWLTQCLSHHPNCPQNPGTRLPKRVIDVGSPKQQPRLIESNGRAGKWVALSHCWGKPGQVGPSVTRVDNLNSHMASLPLAHLSPTFRDAVIITRQLGIPYLWIDSLCIVQGSEEDWLQESAAMHSIFKNAVLTIAAEATPDSSAGIFSPTRAFRQSIKIHCHMTATADNGRLSGKVYFRDLIPTRNNRDSGPLSDRAWVLQEELLSQRLLRFAPHQMYWKCPTAEVTESDIAGTSTSKSWYIGNINKFLVPQLGVSKDRDNDRGPARRRSKRLQERWRKEHPELLRIPGGFIKQWWQVWHTIVNEYSHRSITYDEDRLPAISALARELAARYDFPTYQAGLWLEDFHCGLLWEAYMPGCVRTSYYVAPSWSWASLKREARCPWPNQTYIGTYEVGRARPAPAWEVLNVSIRNVAADVYGRVEPGSYFDVSGRCSEICECQLPIAAFDEFTYDGDENIVHVNFSNVIKSEDITPCTEDQSSHGILLLLHVADGGGRSSVGQVVSVILGEPRFAWCLVLQAERPNSHEFRRVGIVKLEDFEENFKGQRHVRTVRII